MKSWTDIALGKGFLKFCFGILVGMMIGLIFINMIIITLKLTIPFKDYEFWHLLLCFFAFETSICIWFSSSSIIKKNDFLLGISSTLFIEFLREIIIFFIKGFTGEIVSLFGILIVAFFICCQLYGKKRRRYT